MNSRFSGFIASLLLVQTLIGQTPIALDIYSARNHQTPTHVDIFSATTTDLAQFDDSGLEAYSTFQVDKAALNLIQMSEQPSISFDLNLKNRSYELELKEVDFLHPEFKVIDAEDRPMEVLFGKFYRGIVNGHPESYAAVSIFQDEVVGVFSTPTEGNFVIGKLDNTQGAHILYNDSDLSIKNEFKCGTLEDMHFSDDPVSDPAHIPTDECKKVNIYIEVDNIMYNDFNRNQTSITNYVTGLFNVAGVLYENEDVLIGIKTIKIWTTQDGYRKNSSRDLLDDFSEAIKNNIDGDIGHCLTTTPGSLGGIAWVNVLCRSYNPNQHYNRTAISDIGTSYRQYPQYSWSALVITHEMGHNLGSPHTHNCSWGPRGNETLDNCATPEGGCAPGPTPTGGGTIMSYCHITSYGINFTKGFGQEPGDLIRSRIQNAGCLGSAFEATVEVEGEAEFYEGDSTTLKAKPFGVQYSYQWFRNGGSIAGAINPTLTVKQSGNYYCEVSTSCYEITNTVDVTVNKFYVSLHCPVQDVEAGSATLKFDTFFVDVTETEYFYDIPQSLRAQVPANDVAETSIEMEVCMGNYFPSRLADLNLSLTGPPMSNLNDREIRNHKTVVFGDRCYVIPLGDFDPTGEWIFLASDNNNNIPNGPESYVSVEIRQKWLLDPRPSDCDLYICSGDTSVLDAGIPGLTYKWSTGDTTQQITVTQAGTYSVTVSNGPIERSDEINVFILPSNYQLDTTICEGDIFVLGAQDITEAGMYIDTLVSSKGCDSILSVNVMTKEVPRLEEDLLVCYGDTYNDIIIMTDTVIETRFNLMEGCDSFYILNITVNPEIIMELEAESGCENIGATVKVLVSGGTADYEYLWDNGAVDPEIQGVSSGPLTCQVTDASNCTSIDVINVQNYDSVAANGITMMVDCYGDSTGGIEVSVLEGTGPFSFIWSGGQATEDLMDLPAGRYELVIADSNKCEEMLAFDIVQNDEIESNPKVTGPNKGQNNGMIELFPSGGVGSYTYQWEDGSTESLRSALALGTYSVIVMDSLGCSREFKIEVTVNTSLNEIAGLVDFQMFPNPVSDQFIVQLKLDHPQEIKLEIMDVNGRSISKVPVRSSLQINRIIDVSGLDSGIYFLKLTVGQQSGVVQIVKQ